MTALVQVDWHALWVGPSGEPWDVQPYYRKCDVCGLDACEEIWAGKGEADFRQFMQEFGDGQPGLVICELCLPAYLESTP